MFRFFRKRKNISCDEVALTAISLDHIKRIDAAGILYLDDKGNSANISYHEAYKTWCKSKKIKRSKPKYICDRTSTYDRQRKMIFYTCPQLVFIANPAQEEMWFDIIRKIREKGFETFDIN